MKYLTVLAVLAVAFWIWRANRRAAPPKVPKQKPSDHVMVPQAMLQCAACGVHLPSDDALRGKKGSYCSAAHLKKLEG
jgi:uncharacterized protein